MIKKILKFILKTAIVLFVLLNIICVFHAYKFTHFYDDGIKPKKPEEMTFGDKLSAGLFGTRFPKNPSVDSFKTFPHETIKFKSEADIELEAWVSTRPMDSIKPQGTVIFFHGHGGNKNGLVIEATELYNMNYNVMLVDFRAHGNSTNTPCTIGYKESKDVKAAVDFVKASGEKNIILYGISLGSATILKAIATDTVLVNKVILDMPFGTLKEAVKGRVAMMGLPTEPISTLLTFWGGVEQGFWAFNMNPQDYAKTVQCPVLLQRGALDARVTKQEVDNIFNNLASKNKKFVEYKNSGHQSLCKNEYELWKNELNTFLNQ